MDKGCRAQRGQIHQPADLQQDAEEANPAAAEESSHHWHDCQVVSGRMQLQ
jgi:hypothetical protein